MFLQESSRSLSGKASPLPACWKVGPLLLRGSSGFSVEVWCTPSLTYSSSTRKAYPIFWLERPCSDWSRLLQVDRCFKGQWSLSRGLMYPELQIELPNEVKLILPAYWRALTKQVECRTSAERLLLLKHKGPYLKHADRGQDFLLKLWKCSLV